MKKWREELYRSVPIASSDIPKVDMSSLQTKSGRDFDIAFLDMMAMHHNQGIGMAKSATDRLFHTRIKAFAQNAILNQDRERQELLEMKKAEGTKSGATQK